MKNSVILSLSAFFLGLSGCGEPHDESPAPPQDNNIILNVSLPEAFYPQTRAPVDSWNDTPVSVGYMFEPSTIYTGALTVPVGGNGGQHVNTGLAYPDNNTAVSFVGYHPVARPNAVGTVTYDLSKGDKDVMVSNTVSGSLHNTISSQGGTLVFEHILTRITFILRCAPEQSYPEPIYGLHASASSSRALNTAVTFDPAAEEITFKITGAIFAGDIEGFVIPPFAAPPVIVEMMVQPDIPLSFMVSSLTGDRNIKNIYDPEGYWTQLTTKGGERGKRYTVRLEFSGVGILAQDISAAPWIASTKILGDAQTWW